MEEGPARGGAPALVAAARLPDPDGTATSSAALRAAVRRLPPEIVAARPGEPPQLTMSLGGALGVDLRGGADGVELALRAAVASGVEALAAELPRLVAALRARGVRVVRAEVRTSRGARRSPGSPARQPR